MPIYEYKCSQCGYKFDELQKINDAPLTICPKCQKPNLEKLISTPNFQLKGKGWYKTDYGSSKSQPAATDAK